MPKPGFADALKRRPPTPPGGGVDMLLMMLVGLDGNEKCLSWRELAELRWRDFEIVKGGGVMLRAGTISNDALIYEGDSAALIAAAWGGSDLDAFVFGGLSTSQLNRRGRAAQHRLGQFIRAILLHQGDGGGFNELLNLDESRRQELRERARTRR